MSSKASARTPRGPDDATIRQRRERKRATDRAAQREHRRRQKLYVEELEAQLALVRDGSLNEQIAQVMTENDKLRKELDRYRAFFNSVEDLVMDEWSQDNRTKRTRNQERDHQQPSPPSTQTAGPSVQLHSSTSPEQTENQNVEASDAAIGPVSVVAPAAMTAAQPSWNHLSPQSAFHWSTSSCAFDQMLNQSLPPTDMTSGIEWSDPMNSVTLAGGSGILGADATPFMDDMQSQNSIAMNLAFANTFPPSPGEHDPALIFASLQRAGPLIHQLLPRILEPDTPGDKQIQSFIESARSQNIRLDPPTLADFLCENPDNHLSINIKHYLEPVRKTKKTIDFLATYWVLYLLLRWQINRDEESFYNLPPWLRPSITQTRVLHPIATDLLAWPLLRDEVIMISLKSSPLAHQVLADVGASLEINIPLHKFSFNQESEALHTAIADLNNWRLGEEFFKKHPSLRTAYDASFQVGS